MSTSTVPTPRGWIDVSNRPSIALSLRAALDRHIGRSLRRRSGTNPELRRIVRQVADGLASTGVPSTLIRSLLADAVQSHPQFHTWDRVSLVTRERTSLVLMRDILAWADPPGPSAGALPPVEGTARD